MSNLFTSIQALVEQADGFPKMPPAKQAAFRSRITTCLKKVGDSDPELKSILVQLENEVGKAETKAKAKLTVDDLEKQAADYANIDPKSRAPFKANVSRLLKDTNENDRSTIKRLQAIQKGVAAFEARERRQALMKAVKNRQKAG